MATTLLVVPKSMPIIFAIVNTPRWLPSPFKGRRLYANREVNCKGCATTNAEKLRHKCCLFMVLWRCNSGSNCRHDCEVCQNDSQAGNSASYGKAHLLMVY